MALMALSVMMNSEVESLGARFARWVNPITSEGKRQEVPGKSGDKIIVGI
jgi:hypothetical protein